MEEKATIIERTAQIRQERNERKSLRDRILSVIWMLAVVSVVLMALSFIGALILGIIVMVAHAVGFSTQSDFIMTVMQWIVRLGILFAGSFIVAMLLFFVGLRFDNGAFEPISEQDFEAEMWNRSSRSYGENARGVTNE